MRFVDLQEFEGHVFPIRWSSVEGFAPRALAQVLESLSQEKPEQSRAQKASLRAAATTVPAGSIPSRKEQPEFYRALGDALFAFAAPAVRDAILETQKENDHLVIVIKEPDDLESEGLPWEYLRVPDNYVGWLSSPDAGRFLALDARFTVLRTSTPRNVPIVRPTGLHFVIPDHLCIVGFCPDNVDDGQMTQGEMTALLREGVLTPLRARGDAALLMNNLHFLDTPVVRGSGLHLVAHGKGPTIVLTAEGRESPQRGSRVADRVREVGYDFAFVLACGAAGSHSGSKFVTDFIHGANIRTIIASRVSVSGATAQAFSRSFYSDISLGAGSTSLPHVALQRAPTTLDVVVRRARLALHATGDWRWGSFVMYFAPPSEPRPPKDRGRSSPEPEGRSAARASDRPLRDKDTGKQIYAEDLLFDGPIAASPSPTSPEVLPTESRIEPRGSIIGQALRGVGCVLVLLAIPATVLIPMYLILWLLSTASHL